MADPNKIRNAVQDLRRMKRTGKTSGKLGNHRAEVAVSLIRGVGDSHGGNLPSKGGFPGGDAE
jgi:hypothetical protein